MASTPEIAVRITAQGVATFQRQMKAIRAEAQRSFAHLAESARTARASLEAVSKPVRIAIDGVRKVAEVTAAVGALGSALAVVEGSRDLDAGKAVAGMKAGIKVAIDATQDLQQRLDALRAEDAVTPMHFDRKGEILTEMHDLQDQLDAMSKPDVAVEKQWTRLVALANRLGVAVEQVGPAYVDLANSTKGTAAAGQVTDDLFEGVLKSTTALHRSSEDTQGALLALSQMAGKGKVSMEELRQQLGERLPGAFNIAARAMHMTTAQLDALVSSGGLDAPTFLRAFAKELNDEYGKAATEAADRPAASFARLRNSVFLARAEVANGGLSKGLAAIAQQVQVVVDRMQATGAFAAIGARIGAWLARLPDGFRKLWMEIALVRAYAAEWWRQMQVAMGIDTTGWSKRAASGFAWIRRELLQLAFDVPGVIYALRQAFAGDDGNIAQRYAWVIPLRDFIVGAVMPVLREVPRIVAAWWPAFREAAELFLGALKAVHNVFFALFGEEAGRKIIALLVIVQVTGAFSAFAGVIGSVVTVVRGVMALFALLASPAGPIILIIAALATLAIYAYTHCTAFRNAVNATVSAVWDGIKAFFGFIVDGAKAFFSDFGQIWHGITELLTHPFQAAVDIIEGLLKAIVHGIEYSPIGLLFKGVKVLVEHGAHALGYASGGYISGPGTGTSDSVPIWASNGEGMITARATAHYGGAGFIDAVNSLSLPHPSAPADVAALPSTGRPVSFFLPGYGAAEGHADDRLADGLERLFGAASAGRGRQNKPRGYR